MGSPYRGQLGGEGIIHILTQSYMQTHVKTCIHIIVPSWGVRLERVCPVGHNSHSDVMGTRPGGVIQTQV